MPIAIMLVVVLLDPFRVMGAWIIAWVRFTIRSNSLQRCITPFVANVTSYLLIFIRIVQNVYFIYPI